MNLELTDFVPFGHSQCDNMWKWCTMEAAAECCGDLRGGASSGKSMYGNGLTFAPPGLHWFCGITYSTEEECFSASGRSAWTFIVLLEPD